MVGRAEGDFINPLGELADQIVAAVLVENDAAIDEPVFEVETEFHAVFCGATPAAFEEIPAFRMKRDLLVAGQERAFRKHAMDQVHWGWMNGDGLADARS